MRVFIAGSIAITKLDPPVLARLNSIVAREHEVLVGDAPGVDLAVQTWLSSQDYRNVVVHCMNQPRNNVGSWPVQSIPVSKKRVTRDDFAKKDLAMAQEADYGFMIWDCRSSGTLNNVLNLLAGGKASLVYCTKLDAFQRVSSVDELDKLIEMVAAQDLETIEKKIRLAARRAELARTIEYDVPVIAFSVGEPQLDLFGEGES